MTLSVEVIDDVSSLGSRREQWDALAVETGKPFCAPAWMLAWWRHARHDGAALRLFAVNDGERLVGMAPLWAASAAVGSKSAYEALGGRLAHPIGPLAAVGREAEVAAALAESLAGASPRLSRLRLWDHLEPADFSKQLIDAWPGRRPWTHTATRMTAPSISLAGLDYDGWMAARSSKFRQESGRRGRRLADAGGEIALAGPADVNRALASLLELHAARWDHRGGSSAMIPGLLEMLEEAAIELVPAGRMRVFTIEVEGKIVAANLLLAAGEGSCGWLSGFDSEWRRFSPSMLLLLHSLADAFERGEARMDLGPGDTDYKRRIADGQKEIHMVTVVPHGSSYLPTRLGLLGYQARWGLSSRLSSKTKSRLRGVFGS